MAERRTTDPFPGLRPFEPDEGHLFFGRETAIDDLLQRLCSTRFLAVVGPSGTGKSSLVRAGLIPSLSSKSLPGAGSSWRTALLRPGDDPIGHLAAALSGPAALGGHDPDPTGTGSIALEATLRSGAPGLADAVRHARNRRDQPLLVLVDRFEELFRIPRHQRLRPGRPLEGSTPRSTPGRLEHGRGARASGSSSTASRDNDAPGRRGSRIANSRDEATLFVHLLLHAASQRDVPLYVVLTMRSDFIGDCQDFPGLSEAVNGGLHLAGRMTPDAWQAAITGPVAAAGGTIAPRLVQRVLDDLADDRDELPLVQHALMRTWAHWAATRSGDRPMDVGDYEAVGTIHHALAKHAEEAYEEAAANGGGQMTARIFKALIHAAPEARVGARPARVRELAAICGSSEATIVSVVEIFRRPGRGLLMPTSISALTGRSIIDLSHESLIRCWDRLAEWADEERESAAIYMRLSRAAARLENGSAGLWRNPELDLAQRWKRENHATAAWAGRYDDGFDRAMSFLDRSLEERDRLEAVEERKRRWKLRRAQWAAAVLGVLLALAAPLAYLAWRESFLAEGNLTLAREAVDQSLSAVDRDPARIDMDVPQVRAFRRELLDEAEHFYTAFVARERWSEGSRRNLASAHVRLGDVHRMREKSGEAAREYQDGVGRFQSLVKDHPANAEYRAALANAYNWLGEALRQTPASHADAEQAYDNALQHQQALTRESPGDSQYQVGLARTYYNRGLLRSSRPASLQAANIDFREAIRLLEPLAGTSDVAAQALARAYNNLGTLLAVDPERNAEVVALWEKAIGIDERLVIKDPGNLDGKLELAIFCNNLASLLNDRGDTVEADRRSRMAVALIESLSRATPSLAIVRANAHNVRGMILQADDPSEAASEYEQALELFEELKTDRDLHQLPEFHLRLGDLLLNLATFPKGAKDVEAARRLLSDAVSLYAGIAAGMVASGSRADAQTALENLSRVLPSLPEPDRAELTEFHQQLQRRLEGDGARR